jgi:GTPase
VDNLIRELGAQETPRLEVFNKSDLYVGEIRPHGENIVSISAKTGEGIDEMLKKIAERLDSGAKRVELRIPYDQGGIVDTLYREAKVEQVEYAEQICVTAVLTPKLLGQLREFVYPPLPEHKEDWET